MRLLVVAVGTRLPDWVTQGFETFAARMPRELSMQLFEIKAEPRNSGKTADKLMAAEAARIDASIPPRCHRVVLDEHGSDLDTMQLAHRLAHWQTLGSDVAFIIGGADGLAPTIKAGADEKLRLSSLTLPHALVRPLLAEALYRAWTVLKNHPYHRE